MATPLALGERLAYRVGDLTPLNVAAFRWPPGRDAPDARRAEWITVMPWYDVKMEVRNVLTGPIA
jgi:hypothetical protein